MDHHEEHEHAGQGDGGKLRLIASPVVSDKAPSHIASALHGNAQAPDLETLGYREGPHHNTPEFQRHEEATYAELFFDLFFAALLTCFSEVHELTSTSRLTSYVGYFCTLWFTWALVGLFDVRFVTDSIFERLARSVHLGVMIGFAVVAPNFDPTHQLASTFRAFSLILMVSRLTLCVQYLTILFHVRKYPNTTLPIAVVIGAHFVAAMIYLGITFRFRDETDSRVYITWYIVAIMEMIVNITLSLFWDVLSFKGTHLINRMGLLTMIIIGEGIIVVCNNISTIVTNVDAWTPTTIGLVIAATATIYITFQLYFDWLRSSHLPAGRQLIWAFLHFPFHLALTLFMEGAAQFLLWWKIIESLFKFDTLLDKNIESSGLDDSKNTTTQQVVDLMNSTVQQTFTMYPPLYQPTVDDVQTLLLDLKAQIPDTYWNSDFNSTLLNSTEQTRLDKVASAIGDLLTYTVANSLFTSFKIDSLREFPATTGDPSWEEEVFEENQSRFTTVLAFSFISAGIVVILMNLIFITSRLKRWSFFNIFRSSVNFLVGIGLCLVALVVKSEERTLRFEGSPWVLPIICLSYFFLLIFNHLPKPRSTFYRPWRWFSGGGSAERSGLLVRPFAPMHQPNLEPKQMAAMTTAYHNGYGNGTGAYYQDGVSAISVTPPPQQQQHQQNQQHYQQQQQQHQQQHQQQQQLQQQPQQQQQQYQQPLQFNAYSTDGQFQMQAAQPHVSYQPQPVQYHPQPSEQAQYVA